MTLLAGVEWSGVRGHFDLRIAVHRQLLALHDAGPSDELSQLLLGISDGRGNYSASQHGHGPRVLENNGNAHARLHALAGELSALTDKDARRSVLIVDQADLSYVGMAVGSEIACMMNPAVCPVINKRTIYAHLAFTTNSAVTAKEQLEAYRFDGGVSRKDAVRLWRDLFPTLVHSQTLMVEAGLRHAPEEGEVPAEGKYVWADALADHLFVAAH